MYQEQTETSIHAKQLDNSNNNSFVFHTYLMEISNTFENHQIGTQVFRSERIFYKIQHITKGNLNPNHEVNSVFDMATWFDRNFK
jgi:hypothetical protein